MDEKTLNKKLQEILALFPKSELDREKEKDLLSRIVMSPGVYDGVPTLRTPEIPVEVILGLLGAGHTEVEIRNLLSLSEADIQAVFLYAGTLVPSPPVLGNLAAGGVGIGIAKSVLTRQKQEFRCR